MPRTTDWTDAQPTTRRRGPPAEVSCPRCHTTMARLRADVDLRTVKTTPTTCPSCGETVQVPQEPT